MSEFNPLVHRVDALLKRHQQQVAAGNPPPATLPEDRQPATGAQTSPQEVALAQAAAGPAPQGDDADIPVLTEIVDPDAAPAAGELDQDALVVRIEAAVLEEMLTELDQALDQRLGRTIGDLLEQAVHGLRAELSIRVREMVRDAVATSIAKALDERARRL